VRGMALSDRAHYGAAERLLRQAIAAAERSGDPRAVAWAWALLGRVFLLCDARDPAAEALDRSLALIEREGWIAAQPFPEALRAEHHVRTGDGAAAAVLVEHAFSLGCRLADPCWEGLAARAQGLVLAARGERRAALSWFREAVARAGRVSDRYVWAEAHCLDALAGALLDEGETSEAETCVARLEELAGRGDMRELAVRAELHRGRLHGVDRRANAMELAEAIDNPWLHRELAA
jgi:tetratricopeptide (TPR) repeat protein